MAADTADRIPVGYVRRAHGLRGDVIVRVLSDDPDRFGVGATFITDEEPPRSVTIAELRSHPDGALVRFAECAGRQDADSMRGVALTIASGDRRDLAEDEFWPEDLVGLTAVTLAGDRLGVVTGVISGIAQDRVTVATPGGATVDVPFVAAIVTQVDQKAGRIYMDPPPGLFEP